MSSKRVTLVAIIFAIFHGSRVEGSALVEMISDYAKVVRNTERPTATNATHDKSVSKALLPETTTEPLIEYQDFDDLQEEDRSLKQPSSVDSMMKYFNGLVSLLALMYKFNGSHGGSKPTKLRVKNQNEPREKTLVKEANEIQDTGKRFQEAQDRFEFPQKKFKYYDNQMKDNMIDQQYQPVENYPPYNPFKANSAETYNQDDKKTSYDADLNQYDHPKTSINGYSTDVEVQQSYSYEIPYEKPVKTPTYDLTNGDDMSWNNHNTHPVYHPWMSKPPTKPSNDDNSYQVPNNNNNDKPTYIEPSKPSAPEFNLKDFENHHQWHEKPLDFPTYHHDPPPKDHHFEYHETEPSMDEDRVSKKPYSYYFLGRKLWYIPLLFSVYFIIYIGALVLKSVARHKIQFPEKVWNLHDEHFDHGKRRRHRKIDDVTENYENAVEKMKNKFM